MGSFSAIRVYYLTQPQATAACYSRLMLPSAYQLHVLRNIHEQTSQAGLTMLMHTIQEHHVWPGMWCEVQLFIDRCGLCRVNNTWTIRPPMGEMPTATYPGQIVGIDLMGPLFESSMHQCHYLCIVIDHYSGWIEAYPLKNKFNESIWERMANDYVPRHGASQILI